MRRMRRVGRARGISSFRDSGSEVGQPSFHFLHCCLSFPSDPAHAESRDPAESMSSPSHQVRGAETPAGRVCSADRAGNVRGTERLDGRRAHEGLLAWEVEA